jgi:hypothetical protein
MGQVLTEIYRKAEEIGGIKARTKLSLLTKISSMEAKSISDSEATIHLFEKSIRLIQTEFAKVSFDDPIQKNSSIGLKEVPVDLSSKLVDKLKKQLSIFCDLTTQRSLFLHNAETTYPRITECCAEGIEVERASIWLYTPDKTRIVCADLFTCQSGKHTSGAFLAAKDFPQYFRSIETERTLAAHNAHTHPSTAEFSQLYLKPLGINSMLDVPIWAGGKMIGVVCHEQVGPARIWTKEEEQFAYMMGNLVAMAIENQGN